MHVVLTEVLEESLEPPSLLDSFTGLSSVCYTQPTRTLGISMDQAMLLPLMEAGRQ